MTEFSAVSSKVEEKFAWRSLHWQYAREVLLRRAKRIEKSNEVDCEHTFQNVII